MKEFAKTCELWSRRFSQFVSFKTLRYHKKCQRNGAYPGTTGITPFRIELTEEDMHKYPAYDEYWDWSDTVG